MRLLGRQFDVICQRIISGFRVSGCFHSDIISSHKNMFQNYGQ